ncbi:hypothetical protein B0H13DRAFT_1901690 [Mycena leptocephala]|nr:hypothetical protein B0H13DRAFT_1901690 [Mycena leptocephala]
MASAASMASMQAGRLGDVREAPGTPNARGLCGEGNELEEKQPRGISIGQCALEAIAVCGITHTICPCIFADWHERIRRRVRKIRGGKQKVRAATDGKVELVIPTWARWDGYIIALEIVLLGGSLVCFLDDASSLVPAGAQGRRCDSTGDAIVDAVPRRRRNGRRAGISVRVSRFVRMWLPPHLEAQTRECCRGGGMDICSPITRRSWEPGCDEIPLYLFRDLILRGN